MTAQDFRDQVEALIREAQEEGVTPDEVLTELDGICEAMREEAGEE